MKRAQSIIACFCVFLTATPSFAQQPPKIDVPETTPTQTPRVDGDRPHWYSSITRPYEPPVIPQVNVSNTTRLDSLLRGGKLYLSLQDAVALALENNIDIEVERYLFPLAQADLLRAQAGNSTQGISTATSGGATGLNAGGVQSFLGNYGASGAGATGIAANPNPNGFDPTINSTIQWGHITSPQQNTVTTGTTFLVSTNKLANFNIQENFVTGATATLSYNNTFSEQNSYLNLF